MRRVSVGLFTVGVAFPVAGISPAASTNQISSLVASSLTVKSTPNQLLPTLTGAANDFGPNPGWYGATSTKTAVIFGDSHARMWSTALIPALTAAGYRVDLIRTAGCPAATLSVWGGYNNPTGYDTSCQADRTAALRTIGNLKPKLVIFAQHTQGLLSAPGVYITSNNVRDGLLASIATIRSLSSSTKFVILAENPTAPLNPANCIAAHPGAINKCNFAAVQTNPTNASHISGEQAAATSSGSLFIDPTPWLCTTQCPLIIGNMFAYMDFGHLTKTYVAYLDNVVAAALAPVL